MKRYFRKLYEYWLAFGLAISIILTPIQLFMVYLFVFGPARLVTLIGAKDLLDRRMKHQPSFWKPKEPRPNTVDEARHQF